MIVGTVNTSNEALIQLIVRGPDGFEREIEAIIDTGFSGSLSLPSTTIAALGLSFRRIGRAILADGKESLFKIFEATVEWNGIPRRIGVHAADTDPLIGMNLLYGYELTIQVVENGSVTIKKLS
jgi:clan AA aspartic protease